MGYLDTAEMQQCGSDDLGVLQPSVSMVVSQTPTALSQSIVAQFVHFLLDVHSLQANKGTIVAIAGFPGVAGYQTFHPLAKIPR